MEEPVLRLIEPSDVDAYKTFYLKAIEESPDSFETAPEEFRAQDRATCASQLARSYGFGCFLGGQLIGMVFFHRVVGSRASHRGALTKLYVDAEYRGKRIARALLELSKKIAETRGICQLELLVSSAAKPAIAFYDNAGFRQTGCIPDAIRTTGGRHDLLFMVLDLGKDGKNSAA